VFLSFVRLVVTDRYITNVHYKGGVYDSSSHDCAAVTPLMMFGNGTRNSKYYVYSKLSTVTLNGFLWITQLLILLSSGNYFSTFRN